MPNFTCAGSSTQVSCARPDHLSSSSSSPAPPLNHTTNQDHALPGEKAPWHSVPHSYRSPLLRLQYSAIYGLCVQHRDRLSCPLPLQSGCICDPGLCACLRTVDHRRELCRAAVVSTGGRSALITGRTVNQVEELEVGTVRCAFTSTLARGYRRIPRSLTPTRDPTPALLAITRAKRAAFFPGITI